MSQADGKDQSSGGGVLHARHSKESHHKGLIRPLLGLIKGGRICCSLIPLPVLGEEFKWVLVISQRQSVPGRREGRAVSRLIPSLFIKTRGHQKMDEDTFSSLPGMLVELPNLQSTRMQLLP